MRCLKFLDSPHTDALTWFHKLFSVIAQRTRETGHMAGNNDRRNRGKIEIISQILEVAANSDGSPGNSHRATKTRIMYKVFLNHEQLKEYLKLLIENDLLQQDKAMRTFKTTEKGRLLLQACNKLDQILTEQHC